VIRWDGPSGYTVAFSTRRGGVSIGAYESLNLGRLTDDDTANVDENRRRVCAEIGADPDRLAMNRQVHGATVNRATPGQRETPGDGLWTDEPGLPLLKVTADCLPIALARTNGSPALVLLHAGRLGLLEGIVAAGVATLGVASPRWPGVASPGQAAVIGPGIGPCCYEVGDEILDAHRARFGAKVIRGRNLDLPAAAEQALREAGVTAIERIDLCTACNPGDFFSHRRDGGVTGRQGVIGYIA
jgi:YfiH family protein